MEASKEGRSLDDCRYGCVGYSVYPDMKNHSGNVKKHKMSFRSVLALRFLWTKELLMLTLLILMLRRKEMLKKRNQNRSSGLSIKLAIAAGLTGIIVGLNGLSIKLGPVTLSSSNDRWVWALNGAGLFSVCSLKQAPSKLKFTRPVYVFRRNSWMPKKVEIMAWRADLDRLPMRSALLRRNINFGSDLCPFCSEFSETSEHVFVECGFAQTLWQVVSLWCSLQQIYAFRLRDILDLSLYVDGSQKKRKGLHAIYLSTLWCIWKARNQSVFNQVQSSIQKIIGEIKAFSYLWVKARSKQPDLEWNNWNGFKLYKIGW